MFELVPFNRNRMFPRFPFRDFFNDDFFTTSTVKADVYQDGDDLVIEAELPGFDKDEIKVHVQDNQLTISAQHDQAREEKTEHYIRKERSVIKPAGPSSSKTLIPTRFKPNLTTAYLN